MKLLRWTVAGATAATAFVIYKYSIGKKAKGEDVFVSPEKTMAELTEGGDVPERAPPDTAKRRKTKTAKPPAP